MLDARAMMLKADLIKCIYDGITDVLGLRRYPFSLKPMRYTFRSSEWWDSPVGLARRCPCEW